MGNLRMRGSPKRASAATVMDRTQRVIDSQHAMIKRMGAITNMTLGDIRRIARICEDVSVLKDGIIIPTATPKTPMQALEEIAAIVKQYPDVTLHEHILSEVNDKGTSEFAAPSLLAQYKTADLKAAELEFRKWLDANGLEIGAIVPTNEGPKYTIVKREVIHG